MNLLLDLRKTKARIGKFDTVIHNHKSSNKLILIDPFDNQFSTWGVDLFLPLGERICQSEILYGEALLCSIRGCLVQLTCM